MILYNVFNCTVKGYSHIKNGTECEDYSIAIDECGAKIAVCSDGHGDTSCFRSNVGSRIACEIAAKALKNFADGIQNEHWEERLLDKITSTRLTKQLFETIIGRWTEAVLQHLKENPWTEEEIKNVKESVRRQYEAGNELAHIYGTTLIAILITDRYALFLHQGDGRCIVIHQNGEIDQPVPWDDRCEGRFTTSICDIDVLSRWRCHVIDLEKDGIAGCFAISDGVEDSFENMELTNSYVSMLAADYVEEGRESFLKGISERLSALSTQGSGDDISISAIISSEGIKPYLERIRLTHSFLVKREENKRARERLNSMQRKYDYLTERLDKAKNKLEETVQKRDTLRHKVRVLIEQLDGAKRDENIYSKEIIDAREELDIAQQEYDQFVCERNEVIDSENRSQDEMDEIQKEIQLFYVAIENTPKVEENTEEEELYFQPIDTEPDDTERGIIPDESCVGESEMRNDNKE